MNFMYMLSAVLIPAEVTNWLNPTIKIIMTLVSVATIVIVLMQKGTNDNIGVIGGQETETYAGKNKAKSKESILKKLTIVMGVLFLVLAVLFFITYIEA